MPADLESDPDPDQDYRRRQDDDYEFGCKPIRQAFLRHRSTPRSLSLCPQVAVQRYELVHIGHGIRDECARLLAHIVNHYLPGSLPDCGPTCAA